MKQKIGATTATASAEKVVAPKPLILNECTTVTTVTTYQTLQVQEGIASRSGELPRKGGFGGAGGNMHIRTGCALGVNDEGHVVGEDHHRARLTDHDVWLIRELRDGGMPYPDIAAKFDISKGEAHDICSGRRRGHMVVGQRVRVPR